MKTDKEFFEDMEAARAELGYGTDKFSLAVGGSRSFLWSLKNGGRSVTLATANKCYDNVKGLLDRHIESRDD